MNIQQKLNLRARAVALRDAMDTVRNGTTEDFAKWMGVNFFVRNYTDLAKAYASSTGDNSVDKYDLDALIPPNDMLWINQKAIFDAVYIDALTLVNLLTIEDEPTRPIFNLLISGLPDSWNGEPLILDDYRCVNEYTSQPIIDKYGHLDHESISALKKVPCIFAYETGHFLAPKFGYLREIEKRTNKVRLEYEIINVTPFLTYSEFEAMELELDFGNLELYRTHWAVKEVNLPKELHRKGIRLPSTFSTFAKSVDITTHIFDVALSFPGEVRPLVQNVVQELERKLGPDKYFYDKNYTAQLARPSLDTLLQSVYTRAKLIVVFLSANYQTKDWCGIEFRAIREIIAKQQHDRIMFIKVDDGAVDGVFNIDGYIDANEFNHIEITDFIEQRSLLSQNL